MLKRFRGLFDFTKDCGGAVGVIFSISLFPTFMLFGAAIDYAAASRAKSNLKAAADMAVLAATKSFADTYSGGARTDYEASETANEAGQNFFLMNVDAATANAAVKLNTTLSAGVVTATATYSGTTTTYFSKLLGVTKISLSGTVKATLPLPAAAYKNIFIVVDVSQSMGIGASQNDMDALKARTGCIFGCHATTSGQIVTNEQVAEANNIPLRIDIVRKATKEMITKAQSSDHAENLKFALYTMQSTRYNLVKDLSSDFASLAAATEQIDLGPTVSSGPGDSEMASALSALSILIPYSGNGSSSQRAKNYLFIMTDGVRDYPGACPYGHCVSAFNPEWCDAFKSKGITVGVIYTTYVPFTYWAYPIMVAPIVDQIAPNLESCASAGYYFEANEPTAIQDKVAELFGKAVNPTPRLTQ